MRKLALLIAVVSLFLLGASYPVDQTVRNLNIGTQNPTGVWNPPGSINMHGNPINNLPNAVKAGQPCTYGNTSVGCNAAVSGGGSGVVGNGTAGDITYYPTTSTAVGGKTGVDHGLWAYENGAAPNSLAGTSPGQLLIWQPSGDPLWKSITGDVVLFPSGVSQVSTLNGTVPGGTCATHKWVNVLNANATPACSQPTFVDLGGLLNLATQTSGALPAGQISGVLAIANGGNGTTAPQITQGSGINITGSWPNYTISAPNTGTISSIVGTAPITAVTVGGTSTIALTTPVSVAFGGTGTATPSLLAGSGITITGSWPNQTIAAPNLGTVTNVTASSPLASSGGVTPNLTITSPLPIANGGTGATTAGLIAGAGINLSGVWPNQTIATSSLGTVTNVTASAPLASSGGTTPAITLTGIVPLANGGTQCGATGHFAALPISPVKGETCGVDNSSTCTAGTAVDGAGSTFCLSTWDGAVWQAAGGATSAASGGVTAVNVTSPITGTGGTTPTIGLTTVPVNKGGTNATTAGATAANNIGAAELGANSSITSLTGLTTPLSKAQGGTGTTTPGDVAGTNITITGAFPNQTINASTGGFTVAGTGLASSGGGTTINLTSPVAVANGGTGATASGATASHNIGAATLGANTDITSLGGLTTPLSVAQGGTGTVTPGSIAGANVTITGSFPTQTIAAATGFSVAGTGLVSSGGGTTIGLTSPVAVANGGTGATASGATAAHNIGAATQGANSDITSITGLSTPLAVNQGGTGTTTPGLIAGTNISSITGTWPNQTINASGSGGGGPNTTQFCSSTNCTTSGTVTCTEPWQASSYKEVLCFLNACLNTTNVAQTCNYPVVFTQPPWPETNSNPTSTSTTTALSLPKNQVQPFTGYIIYKGL